MSIGGSGSSGTSQTQIDPDMKRAWLNTFQQGQNAFSKGVSHQQTAAFTPDQKLAQTLGAQNAGKGEGAIDAAVGDASRLANSTWAPSINTNRTVGIGGTNNPLQLIKAPTQGELTPYENPFTSGVFKTSLNDLDLARQRAINQTSSDATLQGGEGAWNGSRAGVSDALTNEAFGRTASDLASNLNQQNFSQAQQAAQTYAGLGLNAATQNQNTAYGVASGNQDREQSADIAQAGFSNDTANRQLAASQLLGGLAPTQQGVYQNQSNILSAVGGQQQQQQQNALNTNYNNAISDRLLPLQTVESTFGIIPNTSNGSVTHSSSKSGGIGNS
jgi:hypothetical protein